MEGSGTLGIKYYNNNKEGFLHIFTYGKTIVFLEVMTNYSGFLYIPSPTSRKSDPQ